MESRAAKRSNSLRESQQRFKAVLLASLAGLDTTQEVWAEVHGYARNLDLPRLYEWAERVSAVAYDTPEMHYSVAQVSALILKAPFSWKAFGFTMDPQQRAMEKFNAAEERCRKTNNRFRRLLAGKVQNSRYVPLVERMRAFIHRVLGESPDLGRIFEQCGFGPGANIGVHGDATNIFRKFFSESWTVTPACLPYARAAVMRNFSFYEALCEERSLFRCFDEVKALEKLNEKVRLVSSNQVSFVPKTAKTDRSIAVEPLLNSFVQKGIDLEMRRLLSRFGYNLSDQSRNAKMAKEGSETGRFGTLDLSSASDTVSSELVRYLLPDAWYDLLNRTRSPAYISSNAELRYEKFVSMGNGFCFPLETLIFAAAVKAVLLEDRAHSVYGDDIIVPKDAFDELVLLLRFCGFVPNKEKSYNSGPFRESCGADWYRGQDVRPVYLDYLLKAEAEIMIFHNATYRSQRVSDFFEAVRPLLREMVPHQFRFLRPLTRGDNRLLHMDDIEIKNLNGAFSVAYDEFLGSRWSRWHRWEQRWKWTEFVYRPVSDRSDSKDFIRAQYWSLLLGSPGGEIYLRRKTKRTLIVK